MEMDNLNFGMNFHKFIKDCPHNLVIIKYKIIKIEIFIKEEIKYFSKIKKSQTLFIKIMEIVIMHQ